MDDCITSIFELVYDLLKSYNVVDLNKKVFVAQANKIFNGQQKIKYVDLGYLYFYINRPLYLYVGQSNKRCMRKLPIAETNNQIDEVIMKRFRRLKAFW